MTDTSNRSEAETDDDQSATATRTDRAGSDARPERESSADGALARRRYLQAVAGAGALTIAGCMGGGDDGDENGNGNGNGSGDDNGGENGSENGSENGGENGTENGGENGTENGSENGTENGGENGTENGSENGTENGSENGTENGGENGGESTRFRDIFTWNTNYVMEVDTQGGSGTMTFHEGDSRASWTFDGQQVEVYQVGSDSYTVTQGSCFKFEMQTPGDDVFDPQEPQEADIEYEARGRTTVDGQEVYQFDIEQGTYYISVATGYPVRFEGDQGTVVTFHSWGETSPISPPDRNCVEPGQQPGR